MVAARNFALRWGDRSVQRLQNALIDEGRDHAACGSVSEALPLDGAPEAPTPRRSILAFFASQRLHLALWTPGLFCLPGSGGAAAADFLVPTKARSWSARCVQGGHC